MIKKVKIQTVGCFLCFVFLASKRIKKNKRERNGADAGEHIYFLTIKYHKKWLNVSSQTIGKDKKKEKNSRKIQVKLECLKDYNLLFPHFAPSPSFCFSVAMKLSLSAGDIASTEQSPTPHSAPRMQYLSWISFRFLKILTMPIESRVVFRLEPR